MNQQVYARHASAASGMPVMPMQGAPLSYPLYGLGQEGVTVLPPVPLTLWERVRGPVIGFVAGAAAVGAAWWWFDVWQPLKVRANRGGKS